MENFENQGKRPDQLEASYKTVFFSFVGLVVILIIAWVV